MPGQNKPEQFRIGDWTIRPSLDRMERGGQTVAVEPSAMAVLVHLAGSAGQVISSDELIAELWRGKVVDDNAVYKRIAQLRQALGDDAHDPQYIETIPKQGYRLIAAVEFPEQHRRSARRSVILASLVGLAMLVTVSAYFSLRAPPDTAVPASTGYRSLAVLPFADLSESGDQAYLGDGISEELIHALSSVPNLRVAARTSAFTFRDGKTDISTIGEMLNVDAVLEGSVRKVGDQLRVTVQMIEAESGLHLWSKAFDRDFKELLLIQSEIAQAVADTVSADLPETGFQLANVTTDMIGAFDYYLLGRYHLYQRTPSSVVRATELFKKSIAEDPAFAQAYAGLSNAYFFQRQFTRDGHTNPALDTSARIAARHAMSIDPQLADSHVALANVLTLEEDWSGAEQAYRRAIELNPNFALAHFWHSIALNVVNRPDESLAAFEKALQLDPLSAHINTQRGEQLVAQGRIAEASTYYEKAIALDSDYWLGYWKLAALKHESGKLDEAIRLYEDYIEVSDDAEKIAATHTWLAEIYLNELGDYAAAQHQIDQAGELQASATVMNVQIHVYLAQDRYDEAIALTHRFAAENLEVAYWTSVAALYEMIFDHTDHARRLFEQTDAAPFPVYIGGGSQLFDVNDFGYMAAVNYASLLFRANEIELGQSLLRQSRDVLAEHSQGPWADYVLGSICAIEGKHEEALKNLERAIDNGWSKYWFIVRDPNMEPLRGEPKFQALVDKIEAQVIARSKQFDTTMAGKKSN